MTWVTAEWAATSALATSRPPTGCSRSATPRATRFLQDEAPEARGWLIEVASRPSAAPTAQVYAQEDRLAALYPGNANVRPKIRQQLQAPRDRGYLRFEGRGVYRLEGVIA